MTTASFAELTGQPKFSSAKEKLRSQSESTLGQIQIPVSIFDFATIWGDLVAAYYQHGDRNRPNTVRVPAFRLDKLEPTSSLIRLSTEFQKRYVCELLFDSGSLSSYLTSLDGRCTFKHVDITVVSPFADVIPDGPRIGTPIEDVSTPSIPYPPVEAAVVAEVLPVAEDVEPVVEPVAEPVASVKKAKPKVDKKPKPPAKGYQPPQRDKPRFFSRVPDGKMEQTLAEVLLLSKEQKNRKQVTMSAELFATLSQMVIEMDAIRGDVLEFVVAQPDTDPNL